MIIGLATSRVAATLDEGLDKVKQFLSEAAHQGARLVCFPEAYLPGLRGQDFDVFPFTADDQARVQKTVAAWSRQFQIATILGTERITPAGRQIAAAVMDEHGALLGYQTKNQLDPSEDPFYVPGNTRQIFTAGGLRFGIAICHEGWRYPETVRWSATRGAKVVFHPHHTGNDQPTAGVRQWGATDGPYYEQAMLMRSRENAIYFASVNYALRSQESATSVISPAGQCQAYLPYGEEGLLVQEIDLSQATGIYASRFAPERYRESGLE